MRDFHQPKDSPNAAIRSIRFNQVKRRLASWRLATTNLRSSFSSSQLKANEREHVLRDHQFLIGCRAVAADRGKEYWVGTHRPNIPVTADKVVC
jgi:hypothetical protein